MPSKKWYAKTAAQIAVRRAFAPTRMHAKYSWWYAKRYYVFALLAIFVASIAVPSTMVLTRDNGNHDRPPTSVVAPSLEELNVSIELAERYLNALYKPLSSGQAVQSEASGVPLKAYFVQSNSWVLLGEDLQKCFSGECAATTEIVLGSSSRTAEEYQVRFSGSGAKNALELKVAIDWAAKRDNMLITLTPTKVEESVEVWLDQYKLATYKKPDGGSAIVNSPASWFFPLTDASSFRMLRYTVRHATQEAFMYWRDRGDKEKADALANFLFTNGYTPGYDMRAPLFGASGELPDDLPFNEAAYEDCDHLPVSDRDAYAYKSKVCLFVETYLNMGARDPFLQAWQALHTVVKYRNPDHELPFWSFWLQGSTPREVVEHLRGQWNRTGYGIPKCTPFSCDEMSGIRTSVYGALETELGYRHGDPDARIFADAAAAATVRSQIKNGLVRMKQGEFYRPMQTGAFAAAWDDETGRYVVPSTPVFVAFVAFKVTGEEPVPPEYSGIIPSNSETTFDGISFLWRYRCAKYGVC